MTTLCLVPVPGRLRWTRPPFVLTSRGRMHLSSKMAKSEPLGYLGFTLFFFLVGAFLSIGISPTRWLRGKNGVCGKKHDAFGGQSCFSTHPLKNHTFPCHTFLGLPVTGIVPLFAVHLASSAPRARPNVCSVHLPMAAEISAVGGRFLPGAKATICLLRDKHLQTDTKRGPRLSG